MPRTRDTLIVLFVLFGLHFSCDQKEKRSDTYWEVPESSVNIKNPLSQNEANLAEGKVLFQLYCSSCHGLSGRGDGPAGQAMGNQPADLHAEEIQSQTEGQLYYKVSEGKGIMPSFKDLLTENQRWQLVIHLGNLDRPTVISDSLPTPMALGPDIMVNLWTRTAPGAVRIWQDQERNHLWYATLKGDVFRISMELPQLPEKVLDAEDHGITRLQGATMWQEELYLSGNIRVNDNKGTEGRMVRVYWDKEGKKCVEVVFTTEAYGTTNTPFDHGWSAMQVSADGKSIFVVSGSRTDHGEVQDNLGAYPKARDEALTAKIFKIPITAIGLFLPNDRDKLINMGVLFAEGIRNAYDLALDSDGRLIAVVNSGDYDQNEDMFWIREGHHYGYPWVMGGMQTPQQFEDWQPDPDRDPFLNPGAAAWPDDFYNDPEFPDRPPGVSFSPGFVNFGPDADKFRDSLSGKIMDASDLGIGITTFTPHSSPLGLVFDTKAELPGRFRNKALVLRYTNGERSVLMQPFTQNGEDLLLLDMELDSAANNFSLNTYRIASGFSQPVDAVLVDGALFVLEYGGRERGGSIWKISFE